MAFAKSTQARHPLLPAHRGSLHNAVDFASRCGPAICSTPLRPRLLNRTRRLHYRGPWRLSGPDSHRLAVESLSLGYVTTAPSRSWRPSCWTHVDSGQAKQLVSQVVSNAHHMDAFTACHYRICVIERLLSADPKWKVCAHRDALMAGGIPRDARSAGAGPHCRSGSRCRPR